MLVSRTMTRRDIAVRSLVIVLRDALDLHVPETPLASDAPAPLTIGTVVADVDVQAWLAWCVGCLPLFSGGLPKVRAAKDEAQRVLCVVAHDRERSTITAAAETIGTSRRVVRLALRASGLLLDLKSKARVDE